jgi:phage shock protein A
MKKLFSLLLVGLFLLAYACGGGGDDPKSVMNDYFDAMDEFLSDMEKAASADEVVAALNEAADTLKKLKPRMMALEEKYPELKNMGQGKLPEEFKEIEERMKKLMPKMMGLFGKIAKYAADPKVIEAQKRMQEAMK